MIGCLWLTEEEKNNKNRARKRGGQKPGRITKSYWVTNILFLISIV